MNTLFLMLAILIAFTVCCFAEYCLFAFLISMCKRIKTNHINKNNRKL